MSEIGEFGDLIKEDNDLSGFEWVFLYLMDGSGCHGNTVGRHQIVHCNKTVFNYWQFDSLPFTLRMAPSHSLQLIFFRPY